MGNYFSRLASNSKEKAIVVSDLSRNLSVFDADESPKSREKSNKRTKKKKNYRKSNDI